MLQPSSPPAGVGADCADELFSMCDLIGTDGPGARSRVQRPVLRSEAALPQLLQPLF